MKNVTRRNWVRIASSAGAGACLCGGTGGCATFTKVGNTPAVVKGAYTIKGKTVRITLNKVHALEAIGGAVKIIDPLLPHAMIIARSGEANYCAVSLLCPHRSVEVEYQHKEKRFRCASLGHSTFGLDGAKLKGFAKQGLQAYKAELDTSEPGCLTVTFG